MNDGKIIQTWVPGEPWRRLLATLIDLFFFFPLAIMAVQAMDLALQWQNSAPLVVVSAFWWALNLYLIVRFQGTPGKRLMGLRILRLDGRSPGWVDAINRQILFIGLSGLSILHQGAMLPIVPPGTNLEQFVDMLTQSPSSWAWVGDACLALLWGSCLLILMRPDRRAIYDLWAGTVVVRSVKASPKSVV